MSVLRQAQPIRPIAPRRHLRPVTSSSQTVRRSVAKAPAKASATSFKLSKRFVGKAIVGLTLISIAGLFVNTYCDSAVYTISKLKMDTQALATQTQIVSQQVDSLRSPQNLSNSAKSLGMIVNSNPVFLNIKNAKVLGSAVPASVESSRAVSKNLIPNAALTVKSNVSKLPDTKTTKIDAPKLKKSTTQGVSNANSPGSQVALNTSGIPATPTN
jgi:cell division protein FtsL